SSRASSPSPGMSELSQDLRLRALRCEHDTPTRQVQRLVIALAVAAVGCLSSCEKPSSPPKVVLYLDYDAATRNLEFDDFARELRARALGTFTLTRTKVDLDDAQRLSEVISRGMLVSPTVIVAPAS